MKKYILLICMVLTAALPDTKQGSTIFNEEADLLRYRLR